MKYIFLAFVLLLQLYSKDTIVVSIPPQKYFIEQIAKDDFEIISMMEEDSLMPKYEPTAAQYVWTEDAKAYFKTGLFKEHKWLKNIKRKNKSITVIETTDKINFTITSEYIWLDPMIVRLQAKSILNGLLKLKPEKKDIYRKRYFKFVNSLSSLDYQIRTVLKKYKRNHFIVYHPYWEYYAKRYKINQLSMDLDPFDDSDENVAQMMNKLSKFSSKLLLIPTNYFPKKTAKRIKDNTKLLVVPFSPYSYMWKEQMIGLANLIVNQTR